MRSTGNFIVTGSILCVLSACGFDWQAARGHLMAKFMSQGLQTVWFCSTDIENLVLGDASSLGYSWDPASHIHSALVEAVKSGCCNLYVLVETQGPFRKDSWISSLPALSGCCKSRCRQTAESAHICTADMCTSRNTWGSPISFLRCVAWLALNLSWECSCKPVWLAGDFDTAVAF